MAFPLSSAVASHKLSLNVSAAPSTRRPNLKPTHFIFCFNRKNPERSGCSRVHRQSSKVMQELKDQHGTLTNFYTPTSPLKNKFESLIALILVFVQISSPLPLVGWDVLPVSSPANAVLYSPDTKVPRTGELALRRAIPANTNMKTIQDSLEEILYLLRITQRKPYGTMEGNVKKALKIATDEKDTILASVPTELREKGSTLYASLINGKNGLQALLQCIKDKDPDKVSVGLASSLDTIAELELLQALGLSFLPPGQYQRYPRWAGGRLSFEGAGGFLSSGVGSERESEEFERLVDRTINATVVLAAGTFALPKLITVDQDYWHGWTLYEILRYAPQHNWSAYEEAFKTNPVLAKMVISGVMYSAGDWIAQCFEGKPLLEFYRTRMLRSGFVGFTLHGSLSHYYYQLCEELIPFQDWWVVPAEVAFDQTAGWKLWPFAHLVTYGVIPVEQRLLWVDCVELIWVTILSMYSNEKSEARISEAPAEANSSSSDTGPLEE